jgi:diketogulonate reductase-like aldo/keto reductase
MEETKLAGLTKNIGLSNSGISELKEVLEEAEKPGGVLPAVNQVSRNLLTYLALNLR